MKKALGNQVFCFLSHTSLYPTKLRSPDPTRKTMKNAKIEHFYFLSLYKKELWVIPVFCWALFKMKLPKWEVSCYVSISNLVFADSPTIMNLNTKISVALRTKMQNECHVCVLNLERTLSHEKGAWKPGVLFLFSHFPLPHKTTESRSNSKNAKIEHFCFVSLYKKELWVIPVFRWVVFKIKLPKWEVSCYIC